MVSTTEHIQDAVDLTPKKQYKWTSLHKIFTTGFCDPEHEGEEAEEDGPPRDLLRSSGKAKRIVSFGGATVLGPPVEVSDVSPGIEARKVGHSEPIDMVTPEKRPVSEIAIETHDSVDKSDIQYRDTAKDTTGTSAVPAGGSRKRAARINDSIWVTILAVVLTLTALHQLGYRWDLTLESKPVRDDIFLGYLPIRLSRPQEQGINTDLQKELTTEESVVVENSVDAIVVEVEIGVDTILRTVESKDSESQGLYEKGTEKPLPTEVASGAPADSTRDAPRTRIHDPVVLTEVNEAKEDASERLFDDDSK